MKHLIVMTITMLIAGGMYAQQVEKKCTIGGNWTSQSKKKGNSLWKVKLVWSNGEGNSAYGFSIKSNGAHKDAFGNFTVDGSCSEGFCDFHQNYTSGKFKGRYYSYRAGYSELKPFNLSGDYGLVEGEQQVKEGKFTLNKLTCNK